MTRSQVPPPPRDDASTAEVEAWNARAAALLDAAGAELAELELADHRTAVATELSAIAGTDLAARIRARAQADIAAAEHTPSAPTQPLHEDVEHDEEAQREAVVQLLAAIPAGATEAERERITDVAKRVLREEPIHRASYLATAKIVVRDVERAIADRRQQKEQASELLGSLDGLDGADVEAMRKLLTGVLEDDAALLSSDVTRVERVRERALQHEKDRFVAEKLALAFTAAGYEVGSDFETTVAADGREAYVRARESDVHAVGVQLRDGQLDVRVVRTAGSRDRPDDMRAETGFCKDLSSMSADLHDDGVELDLIRHERPGAVEMPVLEAAAVAVSAAARSGALRHRERST